MADSLICVRHLSSERSAISYLRFLYKDNPKALTALNKYVKSLGRSRKDWRVIETNRGKLQNLSLNFLDFFQKYEVINVFTSEMLIAQETLFLVNAPVTEFTSTSLFNYKNARKESDEVFQTRTQDVIKFVANCPGNAVLAVTHISLISSIFKVLEGKANIFELKNNDQRTMSPLNSEKSRSPTGGIRIFSNLEEHFKGQSPINASNASAERLTKKDVKRRINKSPILIKNSWQVEKDLKL